MHVAQCVCRITKCLHAYGANTYTQIEYVVSLTGTRSLWYTKEFAGGVNERDEMGHTPLHVAIEAKQLPIIDLLVVDAQTDLELMDNQGQTPLHTAVKTGRLNIVQVNFMQQHCAQQL